MASSLSSRQVTGIVMIVLGILALTGWFSGILIAAAGVALVVYGILILMGNAQGSQLLGILCIVGGVILLFGFVPFLAFLVRVATLIIGIVLLVMGILNLLER